MLSETQHKNYDPTRTTMLRKAFADDVKRRFTELKIVVMKSVYKNDCFGLKPKVHTMQMTPVGQEAFSFMRSQDKLTAFMKWLQEQVDAGLLTVTEYEQLGTGAEAAWTNKYILDSYKRGILRARQEMKNAGMDVPDPNMFGGINIILGTPFHIDRLGLIFTRVYNELQGITDAMDSIISRILAQGIADGDGPQLLARKLVAAIDGQKLGELGLTDKLGRYISPMRRAEMLARTEIIRAHHLAMIQEYRNWGLLNIVVKGEWKTAGDDRVCPDCASLDGKVFTLDEIEPMIPYHPMCRCIALPYITEINE